MPALDISHSSSKNWQARIEKQSSINTELESVTEPLNIKYGMLWALHKSEQ